MTAFAGLRCYRLAIVMALPPISSSQHPVVRLLGRPCRARNVLAGRWLARSRGGAGRFVITNMNETTGAELIFIDPLRGGGRVIHAPKGSGSWALNEVPGRRLVVGTFYDGQFMVFDLARMRFVTSVGVPGESYIWNLATGSDGRIYGGTYGHGHLAALDLKTYSVEDCGAPAPPNLYLRNVSSTPDGRILCDLGMEKPTQVLYDPARKTFEPVPEWLRGVSLGVAWNGYFLAGERAFAGPELKPVTRLPFPAPPAAKGAWYADTYLTTQSVLFLRQGDTVYRFSHGDLRLQRICSINLRGGRYLAANPAGDLFGVRGQDFFVVHPGDKTLRLRPIPGRSGPRPTLFLKADGHGAIWGGPDFGQTLFRMDTKTRRVINTATVCDAGGEVYDATFRDGVVYAVSYAGGDIVRYDPDRPWDQWGGKNPRTIANLGAQGYIRPTGGTVLGTDGKLYSGWMAKYGAYGGAIAITDPDSGATRLIENPLGHQAVEGLAVSGGFAYVGTSLAANGLPNKPDDSPCFGVVDMATGAAVYRRAFAGASAVRAVLFDTRTRRVIFSVDGRIRVFDTGGGRRSGGAPKGLPAMNGRAACAPGDGTVYYGSGASLVALDLSTFAFTRIAEAPGNIENVTVDRRTAYLSIGPDVYSVRLPWRAR